MGYYYSRYSPSPFWHKHHLTRIKDSSARWKEIQAHSRSNRASSPTWSNEDQAEGSCCQAARAEIGWRTAGDWRYLLHPVSFARLASQDVGRQMSAEFAAVILPPILALVALRRVMGSTMVVDGQRLRIGEDVPPYAAYTVELSMEPREHAAYSRIHDKYARSLYKHAKAKKDVRMLSIAHRALCAAAMDPNLQQFEDRTIGIDPGNPAWAGKKDS